MAGDYNRFMKADPQHIKPWLTPQQQVDQLKSQGVRFGLISEDDACSYLARNNNYFRLRSYRKGFPKVEEGSRAGQYANLDFKMLVDLSIIDMLLRYELLPITLDIEHFSKMHLLQKIEEHQEDGYSIVAEFLDRYNKRDSLGNTKNVRKDEIERGESSPYIAGIVSYFPDYSFPVFYGGRCLRDIPVFLSLLQRTLWG